MLSAVAARKAAKAAAEGPITPSSKPPSPPCQSLSPSPSPKPTTSKRKPRQSSISGPSKYKKAKVVRAPSKPDCYVRYFDPGEPSHGRNGAMVDTSAPRVEVSSESNSSSDEEMEIEMDIPPPVGLSSIAITKDKRAWSPSRLMLDSSDDEEAGLSAVLDPTDYLTTSASKKPEPPSLSTFRPAPDRNVYPVPENEYGTRGKARILVLEQNETLALVGTYSLLVLQGSISL